MITLSVTRKPNNKLPSCRWAVNTSNAVPSENVQWLTEFLDHLLVLVEFLEGLNVHVGHVGSFSLVTMLLVSQDAHRELGPGEALQPGGNNKPG